MLLITQGRLGSRRRSHAGRRRRADAAGRRARPQREATPSEGSDPISAPKARERSSTQALSISAELVRVVPALITRAIPVSKDCMILSYFPDLAHGNVDNIGVANYHGGVRTLIDWPEIPPDFARA